MIFRILFDLCFFEIARILIFILQPIESTHHLFIIWSFDVYFWLFLLNWLLLGHFYRLLYNLLTIFNSILLIFILNTRLLIFLFLNIWNNFLWCLLLVFSCCIFIWWVIFLYFNLFRDFLNRLYFLFNFVNFIEIPKVHLKIIEHTIGLLFFWLHLCNFRILNLIIGI